MIANAEAPADANSSTAMASARVVGFDVARSCAILGMVVVHFSLVMAADHTGPGWLDSLLGFLDGRAAATFVVLAGIGVTLMSRRATTSADPEAIAVVRRVLMRRAVLLLALGFINLCIWPGDILRVYGVSLLLAAGLVTTSNGRLLLSALGCALGFVVLMLVFNFEQNWDWGTLTYRGLWMSMGIVRNLFFDGFRSVFPWTGFLLFGMWLGRLDLRNTAVNRRVFLAAASAALGAELISSMAVSYFLDHPHGMDPETIKALFGTGSMPALPLFLIASIATAVAVITLSVRLADACPRLVRPAAVTGQMALTWYFAHIVLGLGTVDALGLVASQPLWVGTGCGVAFFALAVLFSWLWKRTFPHGPLEWVMRQVAG